METISNLASTATNAASKLIYGDPATATTKTNETAGKEPISGEQGKGTVNEPYDQGNAATPLEKPSGSGGTFLDYSINETGGREPISGVLGRGTAAQPFDQGNSANAVDSSSSTYHPSGSSTGAYTSEFGSRPLGGTQSTGVTDKIWKPTTVDNVSTSVITDAPVDSLTRERADYDHPFEKSSFNSTGHSTHAPSSIPAPVETSSFPSAERTSHTSTEYSSSTPVGQSNFSSTEKSNIPVPVEEPIASTNKSGLPAVETAPLEYRYEGSGTPINVSDSHSSKTGMSTGLATEGETNRLAGEKSGYRSESTMSPTPTSSSVDNSSTAHESKMSQIKDKLKDKLHLGHK